MTRMLKSGVRCHVRASRVCGVKNLQSRGVRATIRANASNESEQEPVPPGCARYAVELKKPLGMFLEEELVTRQGWGHSSIEDGMRFFEGVRRNIGGSRLAIMHHAPSRTDRQLNELATQFPNSDMFFATENQQIII